MAGKARVHELAKELGVTSKEVLARLSEQGEFVKSASSTVEAPVARRLREALGGGEARAREARRQRRRRRVRPPRRPSPPRPAASADGAVAAAPPRPSAPEAGAPGTARRTSRHPPVAARAAGSTACARSSCGPGGRARRRGRRAGAQLPAARPRVRARRPEPGPPRHRASATTRSPLSSPSSGPLRARPQGAPPRPARAVPVPVAVPGPARRPATCRRVRPAPGQRAGRPSRRSAARPRWPRSRSAPVRSSRWRRRRRWR